MATLHPLRGTLPTAHPAQFALAWAGMLVATLPPIVVALLTGQAPSWWSWPQLGLLLLLAGLTRLWSPLRPLFGPTLAWLALVVGLGASSLILHSESVGAWAQTAPWGLTLLAWTLSRLVPVLLVALTLLGSGLGRKDLFLGVGDLQAPVQPNRLLPQARPWRREAREFLFWLSVVTIVFLAVTLRPDLSLLPQALVHLPLIVLAAAVNAASEEVIFRSVLLRRLAPVVGQRPALWLQAVGFGLGHYYSQPSGPIGVLLAGFLGWFAGKSVLETRGLAIAVLIHVVLDVIILVFAALSGVPLVQPAGTPAPPA